MKIKSIRNPSVEDYREVIKIRNQVFSAFPGYVEYDPETAFEKTKDQKDVIVYLAVSDTNEIIGFGMCYSRYPGYYHLWQLGVRESLRGQGIAQRLYEHVEEFAKENEYKGVTLNSNNMYKSSLRLAIKRGYEIYELDHSGNSALGPKIMLKLTF
ncbi:MAG: GNAT family N-acetyltransferase [bacterium]|nr:GNAT family N-acetyltransferase [bacterium]